MGMFQLGEDDSLVTGGLRPLLGGLGAGCVHTALLRSDVAVGQSVRQHPQPDAPNFLPCQSLGSPSSR